jgi:hypothetical protein
MAELELTPTRLLQLSGWILLAGGCLCFLHWSRSIDEFSILGNVVLPIASVTMIVIAIDGLQRRYRIGKTNARVRFLWWWKTYEFPTGSVVRRNEKRQIEIAAGATTRAVLRIPWSYDREGDLEKKLRDLLVGAT